MVDTIIEGKVVQHALTVAEGLTSDQIVQRLDVQPVQVLIEAVIISVELDKNKELGVNFGVVDNLGQTLGVVGSGAVLNSMQPKPGDAFAVIN